MRRPSIIYKAREDATAEAELDALAIVYRFILDRAGTRDRTPNSGPVDAAKETNHGCDATKIIRQ
jgi:hypothetical protein